MKSQQETDGIRACVRACGARVCARVCVVCACGRARVCVYETKGNGIVRMQGEEVAKVDALKYPGSTGQRNGEFGREMKKRVEKNVRSDLRQASTRKSERVHYKVAVRPAVLYGLETVELTMMTVADPGFS